MNFTFHLHLCSLQ